MGVLKFGLRYWKKYVPLSALAKIFSLVAILCDLSLPLLTAGIVDYVIAYDSAQPPKGGNVFDFLFSGSFGAPATWQLFGAVAVVFSVILFLRIVFIYLKNITFQWCGLKMECDIREDTYAKLLGLDSETLSRYNMGELLTTMNRDTIIFKELYARMTMNLFDSAVVLIVSVVALLSFDYRLIFIPIALSPFFAVALTIYLKKANKLFKDIRASYSAINLNVQENISAVRIVRSFAGEKTEMKKFDACNDRVLELSCAQVRLTAKFESIFTAFQQTGYVGTIVIAVLLALSGNIYLGALTAATTYVTKIISHITQISRTCFRMQNQLVSGGRLKKFLSEESAVPDCESALAVSNKPNISLKGVNLVIGEKHALKNIDLELPYGKKLGIMGGTGSGKSALCKILSRIFDVSSGEIEIDGKNIKEYPLENVRSTFAYVFQDVFLFSNTVDANIAFARPDCGEEEVRTAARAAQAEPFIEKLESGYDTVVGERGLGLSGGQKQRISIARALIKGAPVLILDDASSALDMATEKRVLASLKQSHPDNTLIIAAHRVSSVLDCNEIVYLRDGEIVERGTAGELIEKNGAFAAIYNLQTSDGQLDDSSYGKGEL